MSGKMVMTKYYNIFHICIFFETATFLPLSDSILGPLFFQAETIPLDHAARALNKIFVGQQYIFFPAA
jgi:hypothetical protein